jgi:hypothetical protein
MSAHIPKPPPNSPLDRDKTMTNWKTNKDEQLSTQIQLHQLRRRRHHLFLCSVKLVFTFRHNSLAWHGHRSVHERFCSKHMHPFKQTDLPLQVHTRSCKKSDDIWPLKNTGTNRFFFSHPNKRGEFGGGFGMCAVRLGIFLLYLILHWSMSCLLKKIKNSRWSLTLMRLVGFKTNRRPCNCIFLVAQWFLVSECKVSFISN